MRVQLLLFALNALVVFSLPTPRAEPRQVEVNTPSQGTFVGITKPLLNVDSFLGVPYAVAPLGALRFARPQALPAFEGTRDASTLGNVCEQFHLRFGVTYSEDCLNLNIFRPRGVSPSSRLPVMVMIHGGSWQSGSGSDPSLDPEAFVARSMKLGQPVVLVSINYRLAAYGFLAGPQMDAADAAGTAALNAGYHDQREALRWVKQNIESFGGDASKVTLAGQSAGANSVAAQMLANGGNVEGLFRAAILQSGSQATTPRLLPDDALPTAVFEALLNKTSCADLQCLRDVPAEVLTKASEQVSFAASLHIGWRPVHDRFFVTELPSSQFAAGRFPQIPFIAGNNLDEGTAFAETDVTDDAAFTASLTSGLGEGSIPMLPELLTLYPNDPNVGSPFQADLVEEQSDNDFYGPGNEYKRSAAVLGDAIFHAGRRMQLDASFGLKKIKCWSYLFAQPTPLTVLLTPARGVDHASESPFVFATPPKALSPTSAYASDADLRKTADIMSAAWIHFVNNLSPDGTDVPAWPEYGAEKSMLQIQGLHTKMIKDTFRSLQIGFFLKHAKSFSI